MFGDWSRERRRDRRARVLAAAPAPEGRRGVPVAGRDAGAARAPRAGRRGRRAGGRLRQRGDGRVPPRAFRRVLLPRDEHAPAGRASGDGGGVRRGPRRSSSSRSPRAGRSRRCRRRPSRHAIEARVYAEDPEAGFLPQTGRVLLYREPAGPGVRVESGLFEGQDVGIHYDPLLAKIVAWGATREEARRRLVAALGRDGRSSASRRTSRGCAVSSRRPRSSAGEIHTALLSTARSVPRPRRRPTRRSRPRRRVLARRGAAPATAGGPALSRSLRRALPVRGRRVKLRDLATGRGRATSAGRACRAARRGRAGRRRRLGLLRAARRGASRSPPRAAGRAPRRSTPSRLRCRGASLGVRVAGRAGGREGRGRSSSSRR